MEKQYKVENAHFFRQCHPETCCCVSDYVITKRATYTDCGFEKVVYRYYDDAYNEKDANERCGQLNESV